MGLNGGRIGTLIPHTGAMCLLDKITAWDATSLTACSSTHRSEDNPLRMNGVLSVWCGIEYAAQAMAAHGALTRAVGGRPRRGFLVSVRNVSSFAARLDEPDGDLVVEACHLMAEAERVAYAFRVRIGEREVLNGTATVILDAG